MTPREFHDAVTPLLGTGAFEPFVLVGASGEVTHIDHPDELKMAGHGRSRLRRRQEGGQGVMIDAKDVAAVKRLDQYEGGEGQRFTRFRDTIRSLLRAEPYAPFEIELRSAAKLRVDSPNRLAMSGRFAVLIDVPRPFVVFCDADVVKITPEVPANAG